MHDCVITVPAGVTVRHWPEPPAIPVIAKLVVVALVDELLVETKFNAVRLVTVPLAIFAVTEVRLVEISLVDELVFAYKVVTLPVTILASVA